MLILLTAALLQATVPSDTARTPLPAAAGAESRPDSTRRPLSRREVPLTAEHLRTAFDDAGSRALLTRAREARMRQDTSLLAYDAVSIQRISASLGLRRIGRDRLVFRKEEAARVRWRRDEGAVVDVLGSRQAVPAGRGGLSIEVDVGGSSAGIPYFPGQETLWIGGSMARSAALDTSGVPIAHPLADGAEAYYRYSVGDSVTFRLPQGRTIVLRELRVRPREPRWNLAVGSLWFDTANAQLVRAVYRLAVPLEIWDLVAEENGDDDVPAIVRGSLNPLRATVSAITVEYGLEGGGFWLPRLQAMDAEAVVAFARLPVRFEQTFRYNSVNGILDSLPALASSDDSLWVNRLRVDRARRDSLRELPRAQRDSAARAMRSGPRTAQCDTASTMQSMQSRADGALRVLVRVPCDTIALMHSEELPGSIFDASDELFDTRTQEMLVEAALSLGAQPHWGPQPPVVRYGLGGGLLRYNRVEGLSPAVAVDQQLGLGFSAHAIARIGTADWQPNAELALRRTDGRRTLQASVYRRLAAANDWGDPLAFGSSLMALVFGRDDGMYYRTWGGEVTAEGRGIAGASDAFQWRVFSERHDSARVRTQFAVYNRIADETFAPNVQARAGSVSGLGARYVRSFGVDPGRPRLVTDVRGEGGVGSFGYGRALADLTLSSPLVAGADGAITLSGGSSVGRVPEQRLYFLGGPHTIRGQDVGAAAGDAYWMARAELGTSALAARPVLFYDVGWAGSREAWREPGRLASGAGVGLSILDGFLRMDLARGIAPERQWRFDLYLEARF